MSDRVVAVVVAWNRRDLLQRCLDGLAEQRRPPDYVIVVNNASDDDTSAVASAHPVVTDVIDMEFNSGGAGGFAVGIACAVETYAADKVWIMDDDTVPRPGALEAFCRAWDRHDRTPALLASRVSWIDGRDHPMNTPRTRVGLPRRRHRAAARAGGHQIRSASFVSILLNAQLVRERGLPVAEYFLWNDDFEYTARLIRGHEALLVDASRVDHLTKTFGDSSADPGSRFYNEVRNKIWMFRSDALNLPERALYGVSTLLRWGRTITRSSDRRALRRYAREGLRDGLTTRPRPNSEVFATSHVRDLMARFE